MRVARKSSDLRSRVKRPYETDTQTECRNFSLALSLFLFYYDFALLSVLLSFRCSHMTSYISFMNFSLLHPLLHPLHTLFASSNGISRLRYFICHYHPPRTLSSSSSYLVPLLRSHLRRLRPRCPPGSSSPPLRSHHPSPLGRVRTSTCSVLSRCPRHPLPVEIANNPRSGSLARSTCYALSFCVRSGLSRENQVLAK